MAKQPRYSPPYEGPFLGLNTTSDPSRLSQAYARICRNVLLSDGRISCRPPWRMVDTRPYFGLRLNPDGTMKRFDNTVKGMFHWKRATGTSFIIAKLGSRDPGTGRAEVSSYYRINAGINPLGTAPEDMTELTGGMGLDSPHAPCFVQDGQYLYILDGGERVIRTDGLVGGTTWSGIPAPTANQIDFTYNQNVGAGAGIGATVSYAITWYDSLRDIESNPLYSAEVLHSTAEGFHYGQSGLENTIPGRYGIDRVRAYRRNLDRDQVGWRLIATHALPEFDVHNNSLDQVDGTSQAAENTALAGISDMINGPWAPARNFVPRYPLLGTIYKDRLFYFSNRSGQEGKVHYCAVGKPEYTHADDVLNVSGDENDAVTGMIAMGDQLYIGKPRAIWVLGGEIITHTNDTVATGATPLDSAHRLYAAQGVDVGPVGTSGNSMFLAGEPTRIYIISDVGLVEFDGVTTRVVSDAIRPTWRAFVNPRSFAVPLGPGEERWIAFSFAHDAENGILYMANDRPTKAQHFEGMDVIDCLAYQYKVNRGDGIGAWSHMDDGDVKLKSSVYPNGRPFIVTCVANAIGHFGELREPAPIIIGTNLGAVLQSSPDDPTALVPAWRYVTGDMPLLKGFRAHLYYVRVFVNRTVRVQGATSSAALAVQVTLDRDPALVVPERRTLRSVVGAVPVEATPGGSYRDVEPFHQTAEIDPSLVDDELMAIRAHGKTLSMEVRRGQGWVDGWSPYVGVLGWSTDVEPIGQR